MTQVRIARHLGISRVQYGKIERNQTNTSIQKLEKIAQFLEVSLYELLQYPEKQIIKNTINHSVVGHIGSANLGSSDQYYNNYYSTKCTDELMLLYKEQIEQLRGIVEQQNKTIQQLIALINTPRSISNNSNSPIL